MLYSSTPETLPPPVQWCMERGVKIELLCIIESLWQLLNDPSTAK